MNNRHNKALESITTLIKNSAVNRRKTTKIDICPEDMETFLRLYIILKGEKRYITQADVAIACDGYFVGFSPHLQRREVPKPQDTLCKTLVSVDGAGFNLPISRLYSTRTKTIFTQELGIADCTSWVIQRAIITGCIRHRCQVWVFHLAGDCKRCA